MYSLNERIMNWWCSLFHFSSISINPFITNWVFHWRWRWTS